MKEKERRKIDGKGGWGGGGMHSRKKKKERNERRERTKELESRMTSIIKGAINQAKLDKKTEQQGILHE